MEEKWKDVVGYENLYSISTLGVIKRKAILGLGELVLTPIKEPIKYIYYGLYHPTTNSFKLQSLHRIMAKTFIPNPLNKLQVNHIDGDKFNNKLENLEWATASENQIHSIKNGLRKTGFNNPKAKFTKEQIEDIRKKYVKNSYTINTIADEYNVSLRCISKILNYESYK